MMEHFKWVQDNFLNVIQIVTLIVVAGELVTRLTPTKTDDGFIKRIGFGLDKLLTTLRVPNLRRQIRDGSALDGSNMGSSDSSGSSSGPGVCGRPAQPPDGGD